MLVSRCLFPRCLGGARARGRHSRTLAWPPSVSQCVGSGGLLEGSVARMYECMQRFEDVNQVGRYAEWRGRKYRLLADAGGNGHSAGRGNRMSEAVVRVVRVLLADANV